MQDRDPHAVVRVIPHGQQQLPGIGMWAPRQALRSRQAQVRVALRHALLEPRQCPVAREAAQPADRRELEPVALGVHRLEVPGNDPLVVEERQGAGGLFRSPGPRLLDHLPAKLLDRRSDLGRVRRLGLERHTNGRNRNPAMPVPPRLILVLFGLGDFQHSLEVVAILARLEDPTVGRAQVDEAGLVGANAQAPAGDVKGHGPAAWDHQPPPAESRAIVGSVSLGQLAPVVVNHSRRELLAAPGKLHRLAAAGDVPQFQERREDRRAVADLRSLEGHPSLEAADRL